MTNTVEVTKLPKCYFCEKKDPPEETAAEYDMKTIFGPWANLCESCAVRFGAYPIGDLGTGRGQRLVLKED